MGKDDALPHCIIYRYVTRCGPHGQPEHHREVNACQERHAWRFLRDGWRVFIRDSDLADPLLPTNVQSGPIKGDLGDE
jgi:hypothetical protein